MGRGFAALKFRESFFYDVQKLAHLCDEFAQPIRVCSLLACRFNRRKSIGHRILRCHVKANKGTGRSSIHHVRPYAAQVKKRVAIVSELPTVQELCGCPRHSAVFRE